MPEIKEGITRDRFKVESNRILIYELRVVTLDGDEQSLKQEGRLTNITQPSYQEKTRAKERIRLHHHRRRHYN